MEIAEKQDVRLTSSNKWKVAGKAPFDDELIDGNGRGIGTRERKQLGIKPRLQFPLKRNDSARQTGDTQEPSDCKARIAMSTREKRPHQECPPRTPM